MKLAAISHLASPEAPTGAERSLAGLAAALAVRGHEVGVIAPGRWCLASELAAAGVGVATIPSRAAWLVQWGPQPPALQLLRWLRWRLPDLGPRRMMVWLDRLWPEVVYVNCLPQLKGAAAARALGLPVVWHVREILPPGARRRWFARHLRRDARRIVAVSEAVAGWLADEGLGDRVTVVHNGVEPPADRLDREPARAALGLSAGGTVVGFFAQIVAHKGYADLVAAAARAIVSCPALTVVLAGPGPPQDLDRLRAAIEGTSHPERFLVLPPREQIWDLLAAVDVVAVPSLWPDPLPRAAMEAMAAGRPVVAYRSGGVPEMVTDGKTGLLVEPGDVEGLAAGLVRLAADEGLRRRMGKAGAMHAAAELTVARHVDAMERVLLDAASPTGS